MFTSDPIPASADPADPDHDFDEADRMAAAVQRAQLRLAQVQDITTIGMTLLRDLGERVAASGKPQGGEPPADAAGDFAKISRALRLTLDLEARFDETLRALQAAVKSQQLPCYHWIRHDRDLHTAQEGRQRLEIEWQQKSRDYNRLTRIRTALPAIARRKELLAEREAYRDRGIDGVAALVEDLDADAGGALLLRHHHAVIGKDRRRRGDRGSLRYRRDLSKGRGADKKRDGEREYTRHGPAPLVPAR